MASSWLEDLRVTEKNLEKISDSLCSLANAFARTGNSFAAEELWKASHAASDEAEKINKIASDKVHADWRQAQESSGNMLRAALAASSETRFTSKTCQACNGKGVVVSYDRGMDSLEEETCQHCKGSGTEKGDK